MGFIGLEILPIYRTAEESSTYPVIPKEAMLKIHETGRAPRAAYQRGDWEYERGFYTTSEEGWEEPLDDVERKLLGRQAPGIAEMVATLRAWNIIMRNQEKRVADYLFNTTNFTNTGAVSTEWDTAASATPIDDVEDAKNAFLLQCGALPDTLTITYTTFSNLRLCDQIVDRLKYTFPGINLNQINSDQLATIFNIARVLVAGSVYNSAGLGLDASIEFLWSYEYAALTKTARGQDITEPCCGRTFLWTEDSPENPIVESYREEQRRSDMFRVRHYVSEEKIASKNKSGTVVSDISNACVYLLSNIHT